MSSTAIVSETDIVNLDEPTDSIFESIRGHARPPNGHTAKGTATFSTEKLENIHGNSRVHNGDVIYSQISKGTSGQLTIRNANKVRIDGQELNRGANYVIDDCADVALGDTAIATQSGNSWGGGPLVRGPFDGLFTHDIASSTRVPAGRQSVEYAKRKRRYRAGKTVDLSPFVACANSLYTEPRDNHIRTELCAIARNFQLLDVLFAWYFQNVMLRGLAHDDLQDRLKEARSTVTKVQVDMSSDEPQVVGPVVLGDLGEFCEKSFEAAGESQEAFVVKDGTVSARLCYLQDAYLDVPYWHLILSFFADDQCNAPEVWREVVVRVLSHVKLDSLDRKVKLQEYAQGLAENRVEEVESLVPIMTGITARLDALANVWHGHALHIEQCPSLLLLLQTMSHRSDWTREGQNTTPQDPDAPLHEAEQTADKDDVALLSVVAQTHDKSNVSNIPLRACAVT